MLHRDSHWPPAFRALYWTAPLLFTLFVYWDSLHAWFLQDDFVWLSLLRSVHDLPTLGRAIFEPTVHGTIRPWSDRVFFLVFQRTLTRGIAVGAVK